MADTRHNVVPDCPASALGAVPDRVAVQRGDAPLPAALRRRQGRGRRAQEGGGRGGGTAQQRAKLSREGLHPG